MSLAHVVLAKSTSSAAVDKELDFNAGEVHYECACNGLVAHLRV